ncbi:uncharacterized protein LOC110987364 [Acanthaster planci]|uniref:Uncharacterized protein LOC110987364 n=1 Tax=Acanthaster planci TaxID=133434 RepID=A0A8B7ZQN1_ACAPL|nr:uncharacterized protein LOC110987364 [Acanthaster planci]XP_022105742.1 uncharacterized protein LOC110987364 [Acanthaster planci]
MKTFVFNVIILSVLSTYGVDGQCYNCTLISMGSMNTGAEGCGNPFDSSGIQTIPCAGPCVTIYSESEGDEIVPAVTSTLRTCHNEYYGGLPCTDVTNFELSGVTLSQTCCSGALCNDNEFGSHPNEVGEVEGVDDTYGVDGQCYNCTLISMGYMNIGEEGCGNPFDSSGIQTIPCAGPCVTIYSQSEGNEDVPPVTSTFRSCYDDHFGGLPCTDVTDLELSGATFSQTCCSGALCNDNEFGSHPNEVGEVEGVDGEMCGNNIAF